MTYCACIVFYKRFIVLIFLRCPSHKITLLPNISLAKFFPAKRLALLGTKKYEQEHKETKPFQFCLVVLLIFSVGICFLLEFVDHHPKHSDGKASARYIAALSLQQYLDCNKTK